MENLIVFVEDISSFAVTQNNPMDAIVANHSGTDLSCEGAFRYFIAILCRNPYSLW